MDTDSSKNSRIPKPRSRIADLKVKQEKYDFKDFSKLKSHPELFSEAKKNVLDENYKKKILNQQ